MIPDFVSKVDKRPAELVDIYPTILSAAGIEIPDALPGMNLLSDASRKANFCALHERKNEASFMWRTEHYKLILRMNRKTDTDQYSKSDIIGGEFYDLEKDLQEWNNLYGVKSVQHQQSKMVNELLDHLKKLGRVKPNAIHWDNI